MVSEDWEPVVAAERYEIELTAQIGCARQADIFVVEREGICGRFR